MTDFFRINMPYGMQRNNKGEWTFFNREYTALGNCSRESITQDSSFYCKYTGITDNFLESIAEQNSVERNEKGEITRIWFYNDSTTPARIDINDEMWSRYTDKLKKLCKLKRFGY